MNPVFQPALGNQTSPSIISGFYDRHTKLSEITASLKGVQNYVSLKQVHGNRVITIDQVRSATNTTVDIQAGLGQNFQEADACITRLKGLLLSVHTADCVPLLCAAGDIIGACHAGWRGVSLGIIENFVGAIGALGASKDQIKIALGPAIGVCHFEVQKEVGALLVTRDVPASVAHVVKRPHRDAEKEYIDLRELIRYKLFRLGIGDKNLYRSVDCTYCDETRFFSYRRDSAQKGRLEAVIVNPL